MKLFLIDVGLVLSLVVLPVTNAAFFPSSTKTTTTTRQRQQQQRLSVLPADEERAAALSEFLARAHEDKLRAIKDVEHKKGEEIKALKAQIDELKEGGAAAPGAMVTTTSSASSTPANVGAISSLLASGADLSDLSTEELDKVYHYQQFDGDLSSLSKEELITKVYNYQKFLSKYIVESQEEKVRAVENAKNAMKKQFQGKILAASQQLPGSSAAPAEAALSPLFVSLKQKFESLQSGTPSSPLYDARNNAVAAAAAAGKSRWGNAEVQRVTGGSAPPPAAKAVAPAATSTPAAVPSSSLTPPPQVEAADHGLRADGGVGGWTLAERVTMGSNVGASVVAAAEATASTASSSVGGLSSNIATSPLYDKRNARIVAAAAAGKSRWGPKEIERVSGHAAPAAIPSSSSSQAVNGAVSTSVAPAAKPVTANIPVPPEVEKADHGLRADGGVGGLTLAERVALGAQANGATSPSSSSSSSGLATTTTAASPLYQSRNEHVLAAAAAGKSRWGPKEIERIQRDGSSTIAVVQSSSSSSSSSSSANQRVNLGASLLGV